MATLALNVEILGEFKRLTTATTGAAGSLKGLQDRVSGFATNISRLVGALGITLGFTAIVQGAKDAVEAASDLEQQFGALDSIFKENAPKMKKFSEEMGKIGLSTADAARQSSYLGAMLKGAGLDIDDTTDKTQDLVLLAGDLAATFGGPTSEAVSALASLLRGERDPIERYGVSIKQVDINAEVLAQTMRGLTFENSKEAEMQATLTLLYDKTRDAQGQAARESETYAGVVGRLTANFENMQAEIGLALLPKLTELSEWLTTPEGEAKLQEIVDGIVQIIEELVNLIEWVDRNRNWLVPMVVAIGTVTAAWKLATGAVQAFQAAAGLSAIAGVSTAVGAGTVGVLGVAAAGAAAGGYMQGETAGQTASIYAGSGNGGGLFGDAFQSPSTSGPTSGGGGNAFEVRGMPNRQNIIINVNNGNVTAQEIADKINRANRATGTNLIRQ
jgi:hypothetical protein